jgi:argininosuccinate synthase
MKTVNNKVVLAYSGGLDTTYCAIYLKKIMGLEVHALTVNTGGFSTEELDAIEKKAKSLGVATFKSVDVTEDYYNSCIRYLIFGNVLKNATYPLSVSAERMVQAIAVAKYVEEMGAAYVAHGSTGAGNDQVRFDMVFTGMVKTISNRT